MTLFEKWTIERKLRSLHGWLGALILPWVVIAGFTGFYMNHEKLVLSVFPVSTIPDPASFANSAAATQVADGSAAMRIAATYRPFSDMAIDRDTSYAGRAVWTVDTGDDAVIVDHETGFVWLRERYRITGFAPDGSKVGSKWRWSRILSSLHTRGWVGDGLERWLADITAGALVLFGLSGLVLFWMPRHRKRKNKKARMRAARA